MAGMYGCFKSRNSDSAAMASGPPDVMANQEPAEVVEECSGKKKSKFQTFKKFFARKKRKEPPAAGADAGLKASQSSDNVSKTSENNTLTRSEKDKGSGSKISLGSKALSHDSVFVSDSSEANEALGASQDSIHGKVKSLQLQLKQAIRLGSPPSLMCVKRTEDAGAMSEDDGLPCSPPEYTALHSIMNQAQRNSSISLEGMDTDDDQLSCAASSRAVSPLVVPGDFSQPASPFGCLDNSAAKHKLGLRHKACHRRKPASRLDMRAEGDSVVEDTLNTSITEALEEPDEQKTTEALSGDEQKPKVEQDEEDEEEEQPLHSRQSLRDKDQWKEGEDESEEEQDVSRSLDTSSPPEPCPSEEETPDVQPSPKLSSRASSLDSPRATPGPPACPREYLLDPPGIAYGAEDNSVECDLALRGEEDGVPENREEESSFLQEVLSSLKTPLTSCSLGMETQGIVLEIEEEVKGEEGEDVEAEEGEEVREEEVAEPVGNHAAPAASSLSLQTTEEEEQEEEEGATLSTTTPCQDDEEEEEVEDEEEEEPEEEEELVVELFTQHGQEEEEEKEEAKEVEPEEENSVLTGDIVNQTKEEGGGQSEGQEEAIELEKEPEVEEEAQEKREEDDEEVEVKDTREGVEEAEEAIEEEHDDAEEMMEVFPDAAEEETESDTALQEGVDVDTLYTQQHTTDDESPAELSEEGVTEVHESKTASSQSNGEEKEDGEEREDDGVEIDQKSDPEEDANGEANRPGAEQIKDAVEHKGEAIFHLETAQVDRDQTEATEAAQASAKPSYLSLTESHSETQSQDRGTRSPSKTGTTTLHINLLSPSSEKVPSFFQQSPSATYPRERETSSHGVATAEQSAASTEEEPADDVETVDKVLEEEATPPASVVETVSQLSGGSDQSKARFTIAPAWQRSLSVEDAKEGVTPPSSQPAGISSSSSAVTGTGNVEVEATTKMDPEVKVEPAGSAKAELVLSPGRGRNAGTTAGKPQSNVTPPPPPSKPQTSAAASTEESSVVVEGNPDNPFGVRLRKTSVLHRFGSEEENTEPPVESPAQPTICKVDPPQPISVKPSISQPISNKPALPKKPDVHGDTGGKSKRVSDPAAARGVSAGSDSPSWISVAKQKQKIYKENSLEEITVKKEEQERKSSLPMYVSSAASREQSNKTAESTGKVSPLESSRPSASVEKEARRALSPPTPVPSQPPKPQSLPCPVPPKPQVPPTTAKSPPQRSLSPPTPVPVVQKSPSCTSPPSLSKSTASSKTPQPQSTTLTSPPFSSRTAPEKSGSRAPGLSSQTPSSQRGLPPPALPQDEPPWMALAKKKAKAWSEMPQIVQ